MPLSFASEDIDVNQSQDISIDEDSIDLELELNDALTTQHSAVYVNASYENDDGTGTADKPVKSIRDALNIVDDGGTVYLTGQFSGEGNSNMTLDKNPNEITFIGLNGAVIDGRSTSTFATVNSGSYTFENISFINHYKSGDTVFGGVFYNPKGKLTFNNCLFENNGIMGIIELPRAVELEDSYFTGCRD